MGQRRPLTQREYETLAAFRYELRRFLRFSEDAAIAVGLTPQQHQALLAIRGFPGRDRVTIGELAERLQIRHHSAVGLANRLHKLGLVARHTDSEDRRQVYLSLTEKGAAVLERLASAHRDELRRMGSILQQILADLSADPPEGGG